MLLKKKRAWCLVKKASGILKPFISEPLNLDGSIRPQLIEGIDCIEEYLRIANSLTDDFDSSFISSTIKCDSYMLTLRVIRIIQFYERYQIHSD